MKDNVNSSTLQIAVPLSLIMEHSSQNNPRDELNLFQFFSKVYEKRKLVMILIALSTLVATGIAFIIPTQYRVITTLEAPNGALMQALYLNTDSQLSNTQLYNKFLRKLAYKGNVISFIQDSGLLNKTLTSKEQMSPKIKMNTLQKLALQYKTTYRSHFENDRKKQNEHLRARLLIKKLTQDREGILTTFSHHLDLDAKASKAYLAYTNRRVLNDIVKEQRAIVDRKIKKLEEQIHLELAKENMGRALKIKRLENQQSLALAKINTQIEALKQRDSRDRELQLHELNNALKIADSLGIAKPNVQKMKGHDQLTDVNSHSHDLYMRGTIYLKQAIELVQNKPHTMRYDKQLSVLQEKIDIIKNNPDILALKNRRDNEPYIKNIENMRIELRRLKALSFDITHIKAYSTDGMPFIETSPQPRKQGIIMFGFILGAFFAFVFVLIQSYFQTRKVTNLVNADT